MGLRQKVFLATTTAIATVAVAACGGQASDDQPTGEPDSDTLTTLRVGLLPIVHVAPVYLGEKKGFFEEEGIKLETEFASTSAAIVPSIMAGDLDLGYGNMTSTILAHAKGLPIVSISSADSASLDPERDTNAVIVKANSSYKSAADLEGKTVAINALQASNYLTVRASADELGADSGEYRFVEVPFPDMLASLEAGNVDAANVTEPFFTQARASDAYRILYYTLNIAGTRPGFVSDSYYTSEPVIDQKTEAIEGFQRAIKKSKEYASAHPDEVRSIITEYTEIPAEVVPDVTLPNWPAEDIPQGDVEFMLSMMEDYGLLEDDVDVPSYDEIVHE